MAHYLIGLTKTTNPEGMRDYVIRNRPLVEKYGGEFVLEAGVEEVIEGGFEATSGVVMRFEDAEAAKRWYTSPEYAELKKVRVHYGEAVLVLARKFEF